jgi:hypothetical protein
MDRAAFAGRVVGSVGSFAPTGRCAMSEGTVQFTGSGLRNELRLFGIVDISCAVELKSAFVRAVLSEYNNV